MKAFIYVLSPRWILQMGALCLLGVLPCASRRGLAQTTPGLFPSSTPASPGQPGTTSKDSTQSPLDGGIYGQSASAESSVTPEDFNSDSEAEEAASNERNLRVAGSMSTEQIFSVLQEQPDTLIEIKSMIAALAQQQGAPTQPDGISDEMLYSKIASSPGLRASIATFLHARGYVSNDDLQIGVTASDETDERDNEGGSLSDAPQKTNGAAISGGMGVHESAAGHSTAIPKIAADAHRDAQTARASEPLILHRPTPYNLMSLRDLYVQLPESTGALRRFGSDVFLQRNAPSQNHLAPNGRDTQLDIPAGPGYVVGPGDALSIVLWGGISESFTHTIDREGRIALPESGAVQVGGLTLERTQSVIAAALKQQYRDVQVAVTVAHLRSIRVYVVGDVQRPGAYDIGSLSSSLNALYAAGGPTAVGSLRIVKHFRGKQLIGELDLYDFLLHGLQSEDRLLAGDTLLVPPAGQQAAVYGAVKRPAIYELKGETTLAALLEDAGGATVAAEFGHIVVDRIDIHKQRETVSLDLSAASSAESTRATLEAFTVQDGDRVHVSPILPYSQRVVYLEGHVARPGRTPYRDGMQLNDVLRSYQDMLPEPADKGEIVRLIPPDLHPEAIEFNVPEILIGNASLSLQPFDTVRIYGRYESDAPKVTVGGEVLRPGTYSLSAEMTAAQLVRMAGGFKRDALLDTADLISYRITDGTKVVSERTSIPIGDAVIRNERTSDVLLKPGDVLTVHQITGWNDIGSSITIQGEVSHPGSYGIQQGERLSSILRRAGGLREASYPAGSVLLRDEVRKLEEKSREELIRQIETSSTAARIHPDLASNDQSATLQLVAQQQEQVLSRLKSQPASGRLVIHIDTDIASWENTPADIEVRAGDVLRIPKRPGFVLVSGQVYNASAITFTPDETAGWYLKHAGGATEIANTRDIFIIRANGSVVGRASGSWFGHDVLATRLDPGDVVVVPQKIIGASLFWKNLLAVAQVSSSIAITAAVAGLL